MIVAIKFKSDIEMSKWLNDPENLEKLKKKYSPEKYRADLSLVNKQVQIYEK